MSIADDLRSRKDEFHQEIARIFAAFNSEDNVHLNLREKGIRRVQVEAELSYVKWLEQGGFVVRQPSGDRAPVWCIDLAHKGIEVLEIYGDWLTYKEAIINEAEKDEEAERKAKRSWFHQPVIGYTGIAIGIFGGVLALVSYLKPLENEESACSSLKLPKDQWSVVDDNCQIQESIDSVSTEEIMMVLEKGYHLFFESEQGRKELVLK